MNSNNLLASFVSFVFLLFVFQVLAFGPTQSANAWQQKIDGDLTDAFDDIPEITKPGGPVKIAYKPEEGTKWRFRSSSKAEIDVMGLEMPKYDEQLIEYTIDSVTEDGFQFTSRLKELISEMDANGGRYRIDTANPETEHADPVFQPLVDLWGELHEQSYTGKCDLQGKHIDFAVPEWLKEVTKDNAYGVLPEDLASFFLAGLFELPAKEVSAGYQWEAAIVHKPFGAKEGSQTAVFLGIANVDGVELAAIQMDMTVGIEDGEGRVSEMELNTKSLIFFDLSAGCLWKVYQVVESDVLMMVGGRELNQLTTGTTTIVRED